VPPAADPRMQPGALLGRYQLVTRIARGGMGEVWLATASGTGGFRKKVVIKTIVPDRAHDPSFVDMLTREARLCAELNHPNLIEVFDFFEDRGAYAIVMEYVVGRSLSQIVRAAKAVGVAIPPWVALRLIWECCCGLECAHSHDIIHCDLSPGNLMLSFAGLTKVLDFGVASSAEFRGERLRGKYHYMAPERVSDVVNDRRTDVYALGVIMYVLFTGQLPITAASDEALLWAIVNSRPRPPSTLVAIEPDVESVIMRAMSHDPALRFQDAGSLLLAISRCRDGEAGACTQLDMARFVGSLFPDAPELPAHVRAALLAEPEPHDADAARRRETLLAYGAAVLGDFEISVDLFDDAVPATGAPTPAEVPSRMRTTPMQQLFDIPASRTSHSGVFDSSPGVGAGSRRGLFAQGTDPPPTGAREQASGSGVFDDVPGDEPVRPSTRGVFGDLPPTGESWPWARSLIKP
jgi:tRNA A-37 threonylcarbamoyl transferase component Bud32